MSALPEGAALVGGGWLAFALGSEAVVSLGFIVALRPGYSPFIESISVHEKKKKLTVLHTSSQYVVQINLGTAPHVTVWDIEENKDRGNR